MIDSMPKYEAHLSRHGHNLSHKFDFTSSTGHLLTLFSQIMNPKETISGKIDMFSRTQPLNSPSHVDIETFIDFFFVPLDMLYSGFGDSLYQTNEPYSSLIQVSDNSLPIVDFSDVLSSLDSNIFNSSFSSSGYFLNFNSLDFYGFDSSVFGYYRNFFHNYLNPNFLFSNPPSQNLVVPSDVFQPNVLPLSLMSYNAVYENFYRLDEREQFDNTLYNIDTDVYTGSPVFSSSSYDKVFSLKYRSLFFDYFTSAKVSPLINGLNIQGGQSNSSLQAINNYLNSQGIKLVNDTLAVTDLSKATGTYIPSNVATYLNTNSLRSMFAVEKILSITGRAKKTYDAQVLAHLGVKVPRDIKHEITYIGTQRGSIKIGEIIATAGTEDTPLGDMAGKGYGTMDNKPIKFTAPCHGVFIAIYSAVPRVSYYAPLEKHMQITSRLDFFHPAFEKLGMQPVFGYEVLPFSNISTSVFGWQMRYQQYKQRFDKISPAFADTIVYNSAGSEYEYVDYSNGTFNTWKNWVLSTRPYRKYQNTSYLSLNNFLASPFMLNDIMSVKYGWMNGAGQPASWDGVPDFWRYDEYTTTIASRKSFAWNTASLFYRDPLLHFANIDFKLVSSMSENTLPDLNF